MHRQNEPIEKDNELADFTDRVLGGQKDLSASAPDEELLNLEKTILRLARAFPPEPLEDARVKQMLVRLKARVRREDDAQASKPPFWKRFFDFQSNAQFGMILAAVAVLILIVVSLPDAQPPGSSISGTGFSGVNLFVLTGLIVVLFVVYWISRRK